jgi:hypothetical protein
MDSLQKNRAVTFDTSPRKLRFRSLSTSLEALLGDGIETPLDFIQDMGIIKGPTSPGVTGPTVADLTGGTGSGSPETVSFSMLTAGTLTITVTYTDSSTSVLPVGFTDIIGLASLQGVSDQHEAYFDLGNLEWPGLSVGKTIDSVSIGMTSDWTSSNPAGLNLLGSTAGHLFINSSSGNDLGCLAFLSNGTSSGNGPGIGYTVMISDTLILHMFLYGNNSGGNNSVTLQLQPPVTNDTLSAGIAQVRFTLDDASVIGPFEISASQLQLLADGHIPFGGNDQFISVTSDELEWDLSGLQGHTVVASELTITEPFACSAFLIGAGSNIAINYGTDPLTAVTVAGINALEDETTSWIIGGWGDDTPLFTILATWVTDPSTIVNKTLSMTAASIKSFATSGQLTSQLALIDMFQTDLATNYLGWNIGNLASDHMVNEYGPSGIDRPPIPHNGAQLEIFTGGIGVGTIGTWEWNSVTTTWIPSECPVSVIQSDISIQLLIRLFPASQPEQHNDVLMTEPFEIRLRDLFCLKVRVTPNPAWTLDNSLTFWVTLLVSQGKVEGLETDEGITEWMPVDSFWLDVAGGGIVDTITNTVVVVANPTATGMPDAYFNGTSILIRKEFTGPWNYARLMFQPATSESPIDLSGGFIEVIGNAREL